MGMKGILTGGMMSDSKTVKQVTDPVKQFGMGTAPSVAKASDVEPTFLKDKASNFESELKSRRKHAKSSTAFGVGSNLLK